MSASTRRYRLSAPSPAPSRPAPAGVAPALPRAQAARALRQALLAQASRLPAEGLTDAQRKALGAAVFRAAPALVLQVAAGLSSDLFPELAQRAAELRTLQGEADEWLLLRGVLGRLHALSCDAYLTAQGSASRLAMETLAEVADRHRLERDDRSFQRAAALAPAQAVLEAHRRPQGRRASRPTSPKRPRDERDRMLQRGFRQVLARGAARAAKESKKIDFPAGSREPGF